MQNGQIARIRKIIEGQLPAMRSDPWRGWVAGLGCFALALGLRWAVQGVLPVGTPFFFIFSVPIFAATMMGGAAVGLTVLGLCVLSSWYFFMPPLSSLVLDRAGAAALLLFILFGAALVAIAHELNLTVERLLAERKRSEDLLRKSRRAEEQLDKLNQELLHRIHNILTIASSIASQISRYAANPAEMADALAQRFRALAVAQDLLVANELAGVDLVQLANATLSPLAPDKARLNVKGPSLQLSPTAATSICLVFHELATNAVKYGAWSNDGGTVDLKWSLARDGNEPTVALLWQEKNGPACKLPSKTGLGSLLIDNALPGAVVKRQFLQDGLLCSMQFAKANAGR